MAEHHNVTLRALSPSRINEWAEAGDSFEAASMSGKPGPDGGTAWLDDEWAALYREQRGEITYTVYSYATPIAWKTNRGWVICMQTFSTTTGARHQPQVKYLYPRRDVWCPGGGEKVVTRADRKSCPSCALTVDDRKRIVPAHLALKARARVSA
jgi:hypothetical protein